MTTRPRTRVIAASLALVAGLGVASVPAGDTTPARPAPAAAPAVALPVPSEEPLCPLLPEVAHVVRVVDGDTLVADAACAEDLTIRVIGMNTAETKKPRTPVQCYGKQGTAFAVKEFTPGDRIALAWDRGPGYQDRYGRRLAHVFVLKREAGAQLYAERAIRAGVAEANPYGRPHRYRDEYAAAQTAAKTARRGAWGRCSKPFKA